jgi:cell division protein FtsB
MSGETKPKRKKIGRWIVLFVALLLAGSLFVGRAGVGRIYRSFVDVREKERALSRQHAELDSLTTQNARLKSDTAYMEKVAREKLGMARKDEKVYKFIGEKK